MLHLLYLVSAHFIYVLSFISIAKALLTHQLKKFQFYSLDSVLELVSLLCLHNLVEVFIPKQLMSEQI